MLESPSHGEYMGHVPGTHSEPSKTSMKDYLVIALSLNFSREFLMQYIPFQGKVQHRLDY